MKKSSEEDLKIIVGEICRGVHTRRDVKLLLLEIRDYLDNNSSLRDIANSIHPERDRGNAFRKIDSHVTNFLNVAKNYGKIVVTPIYDPTEVINDLVESLKVLGFVFDERSFKKQSISLMSNISEFLVGTRINLKIPDVRDCRLEIVKDNQNVSSLCFCFNFNSEIAGVLKVPTSITIAMPFFQDFDKA